MLKGKLKDGLFMPYVLSRPGFFVTLVVVGLFFIAACSGVKEKQEAQEGSAAQSAHAHHDASYPVQRTSAEWKTLLPPKTFEVMRNESTERAFSSALHNQKKDGIYYCASCGQALFDSKDKYDSGTGWPSYSRPISPQKVGTREDRQLFAVRTEVHCSRCGGHLGHVFDDGPAPTGLRYCMNGVALSFKGRGEAPPELLK
jgi:peptide-methionine (R)-S-oxide reductase